MTKQPNESTGADAPDTTTETAARDTEPEIDEGEPDWLELRVIPPPAPFTRDVCLRWLQQEVRPLICACDWGLVNSPSSETRVDFGVILQDVMDILQAAVEVLAGMKPERPVRLDTLQLDWPDWTSTLVRVICASQNYLPYESYPEPYPGLGTLAKILTARLDVDQLEKSERVAAAQALTYPMAEAEQADAEERPDETNEEDAHDEPEDLSRYVAPGVAAMIHAPVLETAEDVAGYLDADFHSLCRMATDLANAGVALPAMFYEDLGGLAQSAASVLRGEGSGGGRASEPFNYLEPLAAAYASMVRKLEEDPDGDRRSTVVDGVSGEVCRTTMPLLSRLIRDAAVQAEEEWAARHEHAI